MNTNVNTVTTKKRVLSLFFSLFNRTTKRSLGSCKDWSQLWNRMQLLPLRMVSLFFCLDVTTRNIQHQNHEHASTLLNYYIHLQLKSQFFFCLFFYVKEDWLIKKNKKQKKRLEIPAKEKRKSYKSEAYVTEQMSTELSFLVTINSDSPL